MNRKIGFAVVGTGFIGSFEARVVHAHPGAKVVAVAGGRSGRAAQLARELGCEWSHAIGEVIHRPDVEAVIVATPNDSHVEPVVQAAHAGKHIFLEKPMALAVEDCDRMIEAIERGGVHFMLGTMMHFYEGFQRIKRLIDQGAIGRPLVGYAARTGWERPQAEVSWKKMQARSGGHLFHHIHEIDLLRWWMGDVKNVFARAANFAHKGPGFGDEHDVVLVSLEFESGALAHMEYGSGFHMGEHSVKINGERGGFHVINAESQVLFRQEGRADEVFPIFDDDRANRSLKRLFEETDGGIAYGRPGDQPRYYLGRAIQTELHRFIEVLHGSPISPEEAWLFDPYQGRAAVAVAEAALESARTGEAVSPARVSPAR